MELDDLLDDFEDEPQEKAQKPKKQKEKKPKPDEKPKKTKTKKKEKEPYLDDDDLVDNLDDDEDKETIPDEDKEKKKKEPESDDEDDVFDDFEDDDEPETKKSSDKMEDDFDDEEDEKEEPKKPKEKVAKKEKAKKKKPTSKPVKTSSPRGVLTSSNTKEFDFSEDEGMSIDVYMIYGHKGVGKTFLALSIGDDESSFDCLSLDRKTRPIADLYIEELGKRDIRVIDGRQHLNYTSPEADLKSSEKTFRFLIATLKAFAENERPDYILIDALEELSRICEMTMRSRNGLMPYQGITNRNLWKERRLYIKQLHDEACNAAKKGVIYTTYSKKDEIIEEGTLIKKEDVPSWLDVIMLETDIVIHAWTRIVKGFTKFMGHCVTSKRRGWKLSEEDVTGNGISVLKVKKVKQVRV